MKHSVRNVAISTAVLAVLASQAYAGAVLISGPIALGVNEEGHLNFTDGIIGTANGSELDLGAGAGEIETFAPGDTGAVGIAILVDPGDPASSLLDATSPGCLCEGWGVSASGVSGYASIDNGGVVNLSVDGFLATPASITSDTSITAGIDLSVSQVYAPAPDAPTALFENKVTITNTGADTLTDVRYVRVMDWDVPPTEFDEHVTIIGTGTTSLLEHSHDNGFVSPDPLDGSAPTDALNPLTLDADVVDDGPADHGAYFLFNFGDLAPGETAEFSIFYGATYSERSALIALFDVGAELYSLGQSSAPDGDPTAGTPYTFAFGFKGVGGVIIDPTIPEPSAIGLLGFGLIALVIGVRRRR